MEREKSDVGCYPLKGREELALKIRHSENDDIEAIHRLYCQSSCYSQTLQTPFPPLSRWQKRLEDLPDNQHSLVAIRDGRLVGQIGMEVFANPRRRHVANIGMAVDETVRGQGVGSALLESMKDLAFNWLAVRRIELEVYTDNLGAIALYERHGFVQEGLARDYAFRDGKYVDAYLMACLVVN